MPGDPRIDSIADTRAITPHLAIPLRYIGGRPVVNEQDSLDDIYNCVEAVVRYPRQFRDDEPEFGTTPLEFSDVQIDPSSMLEEINEWESRADLDMEQKESIEEFALNLAIRVSESGD